MLNHVGSQSTRLWRLSASCLVAALLLAGAVIVSPQGAAAPRASAQVERPVIFVHGINQNANSIDSLVPNQFSQLLQLLRSDFTPVDVFRYVDDQGYGNTCPVPDSALLSPRCASQSSVVLNARSLAQQVDELYHENSNHKVTLIGYSLGAAIIRTMLADCRTTTEIGCDVTVPGLPSSPTPPFDVSPEIDNVFFLNGVQQGSYIDPVVDGIIPSLGLNPGTAPLFWALYGYVEYSGAAPNPFDPAAQDIGPAWFSPNLGARNAVAPPTGINYYNFFGDIQAQVTVNVLGYPITAASANLGDLVLLPGDDAPNATPIGGGARFCSGCVPTGLNYEQDVTNAYHQWDMVKQDTWNLSSLFGSLANLGPGLSLSQTKAILGNLITFPMWHLNIYQDASLTGAIRVHDIAQSPYAAQGETSIADEIAQIMLRQLPPPTPTPTLSPSPSPSPTPPPACAQSAQSGGPKWCVTPGQNVTPYGSGLYGVAALSPSDAWAVGYYNPDPPSDLYDARALTEHWNGSSWVNVPNPGNTTTLPNTLSGVAALASDDVWAVGTSSGADGFLNESLIEHWNGAQWSIVPSPGVPQPSGYDMGSLAGVSALAPNDIWAVGWAPDPTTLENHALAEHWDGTQWSIVPTPAGPPSQQFNAVTAIAPNDVWAVGSSYAAGATNEQPLIEHWNGMQWTIVLGSAGPLANTVLNGISAASPSDVWAVGATSDSANATNQAFIEHWNGGVWAPVQSATVSSANVRLSQVVALGSNTIWAVGSQSNSLTAGTYIEQWNGTQWSTIPSPNGQGDYDQLFGIGAVPGAIQLWAVGSDAVAQLDASGQRVLFELYS